jgi:hypothetical protein
MVTECAPPADSAAEKAGDDGAEERRKHDGQVDVFHCLFRSFA